MLQFPPSMHLCVTMVHTANGFLEKFLSDLETCTKQVLAAPKGKVCARSEYVQSCDELQFVFDRIELKWLAHSQASSLYSWLMISFL